MMEKIFSFIPAYRDQEIVTTVQDLFLKAKMPERIYVGICWQDFLENGTGGLTIPDFEQSTRIINIDARESEGIGWAKHHAQSLYQGEDYVLAVDSHSRFAQGWDQLLIDQLKTCSSEKAILSSSPPPYNKVDTSLREGMAGFCYPSHFTASGFLMLASKPFGVLPETPLRAPFIVPRFMFSRGAFIQEVPADPCIYFNEEDITLSLRAWSHGWDVFYPARVPVWHLYNTDGNLRPLHWQDHDDWQLRQQRSIKCYRAYLDNNHSFFTDERIIYAPGSERDLAGFQHYAGVDLINRKITGEPVADTFVAQLEPYCSDVRELWQKTIETKVPQPPPKRRSKPSEGINAVVIDSQSLIRIIKPHTGHEQPLQAIEPLLIGDQVPYFTLSDCQGKDCHLESYAGQHLLLHVVTDIDTPFVEALALYNQDVESLKEQQIFDRLCVFPGTLEQFEASGCSLVNARWCLDPDQRLLRVLNTEYYAGAKSGIVTYFLDPNLKWLDVVTNNNAYDHLQSLINRTVPVSQYCQRITYHPPVIVIPDVLNKALIYRLIDAWEAGKQSDEGAAGDKSRTDPQARHGIDAQILNPELQAALDQAFAKNLLPELHKLTGYNLRYRERHQISCYKAGDSGEFANRRATDQVPLSFRRYAVNIILNEGFAGGEQVFPEYGNYAYTTGPGSALVFPAPLMYEMKPVSAGKRFVLSTFLFDEEQAAYRSCYRQFNDEPDDTPDYRITVGNSFDELPARSIYTRSLKESVVDSDGFYPKTLEYPPKSSEEPHLVDTPPGIMMIENYLPAQLCQRWREHAEGKLGSVLQVVDFDKSSADKTVSRLSTGRVTERVPLDDIMDDVTKEFVRIYSSTLAGFYHVEFEWFEEPQMLRYTEGGLYNCHADADNWLKSEQRWVRSHDRDYSVLLYINSDFAGGELYFPRLDYRFKPRQGMLVAFPSSYRYEHAAEKTTAGLRYALVSWAAILGSQRVKEKAPYASVFLNEVDIK